MTTQIRTTYADATAAVEAAYEQAIYNHIMATEMGEDIDAARFDGESVHLGNALYALLSVDEADAVMAFRSVRAARRAGGL